jgi:DNA-binding transcriptional LysR family regulator
VKISLRRLAVFKAIVDRGGVNAAASFLGISQPSVTAHLRALELEIGEPLFVRRRGRRHSEATAAGKLLERYAEEALSSSVEFRQSLALARSGDARALRIAAQRVLANNEIRPVVADFLLQNPWARLSLYSETQEAVRMLLANGDADLAFLFGSQERGDHGAETVGEARLGFVAAPNHPRASRSEFFGLVREAAARAGVESMRFVLHLQDSIAVQRAVERNIGIACTLVSALREETLRGALTILPVGGAAPRLAIRCFNRAPAGEMRRLADLLVAAAKARWAADRDR